MRDIRTALLIGAAVVAAGCASLGRATFQEPVVNFRDARVTGLGMTGGSVEVALSVYNPNGFSLDATRLTYRVLIDSVALGEGALAERFAVQEKDSTIVRLPLTFTFSGLGAAGRQLLQTGQVNYRVMGDLTVGTPIGRFTRPYDQTGRFSTLSGSSR
jgi:LEA14-like dessication related protein